MLEIKARAFATPEQLRANYTEARKRLWAEPFEVKPSRKVAPTFRPYAPVSMFVPPPEPPPWRPIPVQHPKDDHLTVQKVKRAVAKRYRVSPRSLDWDRRDSRHVIVRAIAMYLSHELVVPSSIQIARRFANRDHSSVWAAVRRIKERIGLTPAYCDPFTGLPIEQVLSEIAASLGRKL